MKINVILQSRSNSSRLPYKAISNICNLPLTVLCAKRLSNTGLNVIVATSKDKSDDFLVNQLKKHKIKSFRVSLKNVYSRFFEISKKMSKNDIIIRATADNPLVDGVFLEKFIKYFNENNLNYLTLPHNTHNLPYGLGAEIIKVEKLHSIKNQLDSKDKEHVTIKFQKKINPADFKIKSLYLKKNFSKIKCSIDNIDDYLFVRGVFENFKKPIEVGWKSIVYHKSFLLKKKYFSKEKSSKIIIGGAQIGQKYNLSSGIKKKELSKIINLAKKNNISSFDTAAGYEKSEKIIGECLQNNTHKFDITTKISKKVRKIEDLYFEFYNSLFNLKQKKVNILLTHSFANLKNEKNLYMNFFTNLKKLNLINKCGVSIYAPSEFKKSNKIKFIDVIQLPINIIDNRWNFIEKLKERKKIIARSIFLRGLLLNDNKFPQWFLEKKELKAKINFLCKKLKQNRKSLLINYAISKPFVNKIILGFNSLKEFKDILKFKKKRISKKNLLFIDKFISIKNKKILDLRNY